MSATVKVEVDGKPVEVPNGKMVMEGRRELPSRGPAVAGMRARRAAPAADGAKRLKSSG
jgi:hypothetical protein